MLHLDTQHKVWLEQETHFDEIWILLKHLYEKQNKDVLEQMRKEVEEEIANSPEIEMDEEQEERAEKIDKEFRNPIGFGEDRGEELS